MIGNLQDMFDMYYSEDIPF